MPCLDHFCLVHSDETTNLVEFACSEPMIPCEGNRRQPEFRLQPITPSVDVPDTAVRSRPIPFGLQFLANVSYGTNVPFEHLNAVSNPPMITLPLSEPTFTAGRGRGEESLTRAKPEQPESFGT
jgi:hypothetical protein